MENSHSLATDSFSYSWLIDRPPPPNLRRIEDDDDFHFDVPSSIYFVNADEIFSEGQIMPVCASRTEAAASVPASPLSAADRNPYYILAKWRRSSKKILHKCLGFVHRSVGCSRKCSRVDDLQRKVLESLEASPRRSSSAYSAVEMGDFDSGDGYYCLKIDQNWRSSPTSTSPRRSSSYARCDADDNSIREAILYCKRSIEK